MSLHQQGKSQRTIWLVRFCIATNRSLFIATNNVDWWYEQITKEMPSAKDQLKKQDGGLLIEKL